MKEPLTEDEKLVAKNVGDFLPDPVWHCVECGSNDGPHFDRVICACGKMHYYCGNCGAQDDPCES